MSAEKDAGLTQKILRSAKTEHGTKAIPNGRPEIQPRNTTNPTDRTRGFQTWKKTGNLNKQKPLIPQSVNWKVQGIIQGHTSHNSTLVKARQNIVLAKSGELIGYVWTLNTYYELLMRLRWAFLWGRFMENGGWRVIGKWFGELLLHSRRLTHSNHEVCTHA